MRNVSIRALMGAIVLVGLGFCALREADPFWESVAYTTGLVSLIGGLIAVVGTDGAKRRRWAGYCLAGWGYWLAIFGPLAPEKGGPYLLTAHAIREMTAEFRGPREVSTYLNDLKNLQRRMEDDAQGAEAELQTLRLGIPDTKDPAIVKAEARLATLTSMALRNAKVAEEYRSKVLGRSPYTRIFPGLIHAEAFTRISHSLLTILAAWTGWGATAWIQGRGRDDGSSPG